MDSNGKISKQRIRGARYKTQDAGQTLMELLLALGLFAFIMTAVFALVFGGLTTGLRSEEQDYATMLVQEGLDAARSIRDTNWDTFIAANDAPNTHGVSNSGTGWSWSGTNNEIPQGPRKYIREITVENVSRDAATNDIVVTGGTDDPHTKKVISRVKWNNGLSLQDVSLSEYLTDWNYNTWEQTTYNDFSTGSTIIPADRIEIKDSANSNNADLGLITPMFSSWTQINDTTTSYGFNFIGNGSPAVGNAKTNITVSGSGDLASVVLSSGFAPYSASGTYTSGVLDTGQKSDFTTASWTASTTNADNFTHTTDADFNGTHSTTAVYGTGPTASVKLSPSPIDGSIDLSKE
ncbi:hypothetical protein EPN15_04820, partial [Patescibacteria group bacterium]